LPSSPPSLSRVSPENVAAKNLRKIETRQVDARLEAKEEATLDDSPKVGLPETDAHEKRMTRESIKAEIARRPEIDFPRANGRRPS